MSEPEIIVKWSTSTLGPFTEGFLNGRHVTWKGDHWEDDEGNLVTFALGDIFQQDC